MNPSKEVEEASGEEMGMGEKMEGVVTTLDAMMSAMDAVEAMVTAVEMREWLEVGRPETERTTAVLFFSRALAVQKQKDYFGETRRYTLPLYWPGLLPGLVQLLLDSLLPHNSKAIQSGALLSIKHLISSKRSCWDAPHEEISNHASDHLLRLLRETDCTKIRDQVICLLGRIASPSFHWFQKIDRRSLLPLLTDIVGKYAVILEPTDTEISSLNTALKALHQVLDHFGCVLNAKPHRATILEIVPVLTGIFQEPGKRKKAQIRASQCLAKMASQLDGDGNFFLDSGVIGMLVEALRVGKEPTPVLVHALGALGVFLRYEDEVVRGAILDMGALDAVHLVLKRPNGRFKPLGDWDTTTLWNRAMCCLRVYMEGGEEMEAILSQEGLVELILELGMGMEMDPPEDEEMDDGYHGCTLALLNQMTRQCSEDQMRQLMLKGPLFRLLNRYLNWGVDEFNILWMVRLCLEKCPVANQPILRRLIDSSGIIDTVHRFSRDDRGCFSFRKGYATDFLKTYLNNPPPPPPLNNLPAVIYTRNVPL